MATEKKTKKARKQPRDQKPGKVIRIPKDLKDLLSREKEPGESWGAVINRLLRTHPESLSMWTLPSRLLPTKAEARGIAIREAAQSGLDLDLAEQPIRVCEVED